MGATRAGIVCEGVDTRSYTLLDLFGKVIELALGGLSNRTS